MVEYLSGGRIQGSSTLSSSPAQTSWKLLDRVPFDSGSTSTLDSGTFTPTKDNMMFLYHICRPSSGDQNIRLRFNGDTSDNYSERYSLDFGGSNVQNSQTNIALHSGVVNENFGVFEFKNIASREQLCLGRVVGSGTDGNSNPSSRTQALKWTNTSNQVNRIELVNTSTGNFEAGSELIILGYDNDESNSGSNFWQVLKTAELTSASANFESGQISTTKKYLWIQAEYDVTSTGNVGILRGGTGGTFDLGNVMSTRFSHDGASDNSPQTGVSYAIVSPSSDGSSRVFVSCFIVNKSDKEKLGISDGCDMATTGSGTAPDRTQGAFKWSTTSAQLDIFKFGTADGGNLNNGKMTIWGAD